MFPHRFSRVTFHGECRRGAAVRITAGNRWWKNDGLIVDGGEVTSVLHLRGVRIQDDCCGSDTQSRLEQTLSRNAG